VGNHYEILETSECNESPLIITNQNTGASQEATCYNIGINDLTLPNSLLKSGYGGIIGFYPYVYVVFKGVTGCGGNNQNILYSNNPASVVAIFKLPLPQTIQDILIRPFVTLQTAMVQTIKFKPQDNFLIQIILPNGDIFETEEQDYVEPSQVNEKVQVSLTININRTACPCCKFNDKYIRN
jgi:hypothetical protein